jgi:hypothetical protein
MNAKYYRTSGLDDFGLPDDTDSVAVQLPNGEKIELGFRRSSGDVFLNASGRMKILPRAANLVRIEVKKR